MFLNRHSIPQETPYYRAHHERLLFARYPGMLHDIMRLHIVFVVVLPLQHHIIDKLFVNNKDLTPHFLPHFLHLTPCLSFISFDNASNLRFFLCGKFLSLDKNLLMGDPLPSRRFTLVNIADRIFYKVSILYLTCAYTVHTILL
jgi:hypothetical protein